MKLKRTAIQSLQSFLDLITITFVGVHLIWNCYFSKLVGIHIVPIYSPRVGHLWANPEAARRFALLDWNCNRRLTLNFFVEIRPYGSQPVNKALMRYWKRHFLFLPFWMSNSMHRLAKKNFNSVKNIIERGPSLPAINWRETSSISNQKLALWAELHNQDLVFSKFKNRGYVMIHVRDDMYLNKEYPEIDWSHHSYRNQKIDNFLPTIKYVLARGYGAVRAGKFAEKPASVTDPFFIDLPFSGLYSDELDVALWSNCAFSISTGSGPDVTPAVVGNPSLVCGLLPFFQDESSLPYTRVYIPRLLSPESDVPLTPEQVRRVINPSWFKTRDFEEAGLKIEPMSADEILRVSVEFVADFEVHGRNLSDYPGAVQRFFPWGAM